jgi:hypothetical protein
MMHGFHNHSLENFSATSAGNSPDLMKYTATTTNQSLVDSNENIVLDDEMVAILANWSAVVEARRKAGRTKPTAKIISYLRLRDS